MSNLQYALRNKKDKEASHCANKQAHNNAPDYFFPSLYFFVISVFPFAN